MAAGVKTDQSQWTRWPGGVAILDFYPVPGTAGAMVCTGILLGKDTLLQVIVATHTNLIITASDDYVNEFSITADNEITNTALDCSNKFMHVRVARGL